MIESQLQPNDAVERCGLILENGDIIEVRNVALEPENSYEMDPIGVLEYIDQAIATWHTHPKGPSGLSGEDHKGFLYWPKLEHLVISPDGVRSYRVDNGVVVECA